MLEFRFELKLGGSWVDVTSYVRQTTPTTIKRGSDDESVKLTPSTAKFVLDNTDDRFNPRNPTGPYFGLLVRNTPVRIFAVVAGKPYVLPGGEYPRFYGEIYGFEPRWNEDRSNCYVAIDAAGILRRIIQNQVEPKSSYRQWVNKHAGNPVAKHYWALEDGSDAVEGLPDVGANAAVFNKTPTKKSWGSGELNDWFPNGVAIQNLYGIVFPCDMRSSSASAWEVSVVVNSDSDQANASLEIDCVTQKWWVTVSYVTNGLQIIKPDGTVYTPPAVTGTLKDLGPMMLTARFTVVSGLLRIYAILEPINRQSDSISAATVSVAGYSLAFPRQITVYNASNADASVTVSNLSVSESDTATTNLVVPYRQTKGLPNEVSQVRFDRLSLEQGVPSSFAGFSFPRMGRQFVKSYEEHLEEIASTSDAIIYEGKDDGSLILSQRGDAWFYPVADIPYAALVGIIEPTEDDQQTVNQVSVTNLEAGLSITRKQSGTMSVDEIGLFSEKLDVNAYSQSTATSLGYLAVARGTLDAPRFPSITVSGVSTPALYAYDAGTFGFLRIGIGTVIRLTGASDAGYFDDLYLSVVGMEESFSQADHRMTFNVVPADINYWRYRVENAGSLSMVEMDDCTTSSLVNPTATTIDVETPTSRWTTTPGDMPFDVIIAGERVTVTAISNVDSDTQRFTVTRSVNGVVKSLPGGSRVELFPGKYLGAF